MKFNDVHVKIIQDLNRIMIEGWSFYSACGQLKLEPRSFKKRFTPEEFAVLNNMKKHYDFYRRITPLGKKMPNFFKDHKETPH